jgi:hypothetical protein
MFEDIESLFPIIILIIGCAIFIYLITNVVCVNKEGFKEGADTETDNKKKVEQSFGDKTKSILENLTVDSNRQKYEDQIIDTNDWVDSKILQSLVANGVNPSASDEDNYKKIQNINNLAQFKKTLNGSIKYLDGIRTKGSVGLW